jgi:hypothetical protein
MIHAEDILILRGNRGTDRIVEALCSDKFNNIVFSYAAQPIQMLHHSVHVNANKHKQLSNFMAYMDISLDEFMEGDRHYDYLIIYTPELPEAEIIEAVKNWLVEEELSVEQVIVVCQ